MGINYQSPWKSWANCVSPHQNAHDLVSLILKENAISSICQTYLTLKCLRTRCFYTEKPPFAMFCDPRLVQTLLHLKW